MTLIFIVAGARAVISLAIRSASGVHGSTAREDNVRVQVTSTVHVALHDGVVRHFVDAGGLHVKERG